MMATVQELNPKTDDLTEIQATRKSMEHLIEVCCFVFFLLLNLFFILFLSFVFLVN